MAASLHARCACTNSTLRSPPSWPPPPPQTWQEYGHGQHDRGAPLQDSSQALWPPRRQPSAPATPPLSAICQIRACRATPFRACLGRSSSSPRWLNQAFGPHFDYSALPATGGWYTGGWESDAAARERVQRVADSIFALARPQEVRAHTLSWVVDTRVAARLLAVC